MTPEIAITLIIVACLYYAYGLIWLSLGVKEGWLSWDGPDAAIALYVALLAAIWPWLLYKIYRDVSRGQNTTEL